MAENVLGPMDVSLDSRYTGTFEARAKASTVQVQQSPASNDPTSRSSTDDDDDDDGDEGNELHFVDVSPERARGWIGDDRRPEEFDRHSLGRVELINSLGPITLNVAQLQPPSAIRR